MKIITKEQLESKMYYGTENLSREDVKQVIKFLEENDLIEFKKHLKLSKRLLKLLLLTEKTKNFIMLLIFI